MEGPVARMASASAFQGFMASVVSEGKNLS